MPCISRILGNKVSWKLEIQKGFPSSPKFAIQFLRVLFSKLFVNSTKTFKYRQNLLFFMRRHHGEGKIKKIFGYILIITMFGSVFTFVFFGFQTSGRASGSVEYNGLQFINRGPYWSTIIGGREALFTYLPSDLGFIFVTNDVTDKLKNVVQIDTTSEFNDTFSEPIALAQFQMGSTLNNFNIFLRSGFTTEQQNFPVITCNQSTNFVPVIYFKSSNITSVSLENNCVVVELTSPSDAIRVKDRLVYGIFGII